MKGRLKIILSSRSSPNLDLLGSLGSGSINIQNEEKLPVVDRPIDDSYEGASHGSRSDCLAPLKISKKDTYGPKCYERIPEIRKGAYLAEDV